MINEVIYDKIDDCSILYKQNYVKVTKKYLGMPQKMMVKKSQI